MVTLFFVCGIAVVIAALLYWLLTFLPLGEPFNRLLRGLIIIGLILFILVTLYNGRGQILH
jgi:hypothetical protein